MDVFGKDNFFIELQPHNMPEQIQVNKTLRDWSKKHGLRMIATNDVHYVREEDSAPHDVLLCVQTGTTVDAENRMRMTDLSLFLRSREQMEAAFRPHTDLPQRRVRQHAAHRRDVRGRPGRQDLPPARPAHSRRLHVRDVSCAISRRRDWPGSMAIERNDPAVQERKERELRIIHEMGFDVYFLIVADLCDYARSRNIWWNVRGSGAGSVVAYCTGITGLDPIKNNLIFERFLNPAASTCPTSTWTSRTTSGRR